MHSNTLRLFREYCLHCFDIQTSVLEIGPDSSPSSLCREAEGNFKIWNTVDFKREIRLDFTMDKPEVLPVESESYDIVLSANVLEHVRKPWKWIKEVARVVKPGGLVITITPTSWPYHEAPIDCFRFFPEGMISIYQEAELDVVLCKNQTLERPHRKGYIPGVSVEWQPKVKILLNYLMYWPVQCAYDTVAIGRKKG